jgi:hypothetical protein
MKPVPYFFISLFALSLHLVADEMKVEKKPVEKKSVVVETDSKRPSEEIKKLEKGRPVGERILASPEMPEPFLERTWNEGVLDSNLGKVTWHDFYADKGEMKVTFRMVHPPLKVWEVKSPKQMLDDALDDILARDPGLSLTSEKDFKLDGFEGKSLYFKQNETGKILRTDYLILNPDIFIFRYFGPKEGLEDANVKKFFQSMKTKQAPRKNTPSNPK